MDLWKQAYQAQFGTNPDDDMAEHEADVVAWQASWQSGYDAGEDWAVALVPAADPAEEANA